ncbi:hypothetical protein KAS14_06350 [Candidatus Bathyarchaeota archaeon]|nr:hypothetical protein [Candidatus Bathyarchaeota archaeon]
MRKLKVESLRLIERVANKIAPGRAPSFVEVHVIKALEIIDTKKTVGRVRLSEMLGLGGGATRTLVRHLARERLIDVSRSGMTLSRFGAKIFSDIRSRMSEEIELPESPLTVRAFNVAILIRNIASLVKYGVEQRDAAIKVGASGATTLIFSSGKLTIPRASGDIFKNIQPIRDRLMSELKPKENDVIIIGSADNERSADLGAKAAAFELLKSEKV